MLKNEFISDIYCKELETNIKGFFSKKNLDILKEDANKGSVLQGMEYRPDKLAAYYLGDEKLGWLLTLSNGFDNGIADYYLGRELIIPTERSLLKLKKE